MRRLRPRKPRVTVCNRGVLEVRTPSYIIVVSVDAKGCKEGPVTFLRVMERKPAVQATTGISRSKR